ncbi:MAG: C45 family autoproteolytic acyltransferase/hydrolase, partial [Planctomycetaceae bacterium]
MIRFSRSALVLLLATSFVDAQDKKFEYPWAAKQTADGAKLEYIQGTPVMFLSGTPKQIGRQQAELAGLQMKPLVKMPKRAVAEMGASKQWPFIVFAANNLMKQAPKDHVTELKELIEVGQHDYQSLMVGNGLIELRRMGGCASFVVMPEKSKSGKLLFGRNFDFPDFDVLHKYHCVFVVKPTGKHAFVSIGYPGLVGVISGINDAGLAVATLDVYRTGDGSPQFNAMGCPLAMTYRRILEECTTVAEAQKILEESPRTTYMNLVVCDAKTARTFELSPKQVGVREPEDSVLGCTNHFRVKGMFANETCWRYDALKKLRENTPQFDVKSVHKAMHAVNQG